jgi:hypothetical protein
MWADKSFKPTIQNRISSVDDYKPWAEQLVIFIDNATRAHEDPVRNHQMFVNQKVAEIATMGFIMMEWTK